MYEENLYVPLSVSCVPLTEVLNYISAYNIYTYKRKSDLPSTTCILIDLIVFLLQYLLATYNVLVFD